MLEPDRPSTTFIPDLYRWRVRLFGGNEYSAASEGWNVPLSEAAARDDVAMVLWEATGFPTVSFAMLPGREVYKHLVSFRVGDFRDYPWYCDADGYVRYTALGYVEGTMAVETRVYQSGLIHTSTYEVG